MKLRREREKERNAIWARAFAVSLTSLLALIATVLLAVKAPHSLVWLFAMLGYFSWTHTRGIQQGIETLLEDGDDDDDDET
jgi:hypothetical protein